MTLMSGIPPMLEPYLEQYRDCFSRSDTFEHFKEYETGLICGHEPTVAGINRLFIQPRDPSTKRRFMTESPWSENRVMTRLAGMVRRGCEFKNPGRGFLVIDDVHLEHDKDSGQAAKGMKGLSWRKLPEGGFGLCHTIVTAQWYTPHGHFPTGFRLWHEDGVGKNRLAYWLIRRARRMGFLFQTVVFDSWYLCPLISDYCEELGLFWISRLKSDRIGFIANQRVNILEWFERIPAAERKPLTIDGRDYTYASRCVRLTNGKKVKVVALYAVGRSEETILIATNATSWTPDSIIRA